MTYLIADVNAIGFLMRYEKILSLLGFKVIVPRYFDDKILLEMAKMYNGYLITYDSDFMGYREAIVLPRTNKWEKCLTYMLKEMARRGVRRL